MRSLETNDGIVLWAQMNVAEVRLPYAGIIDEAQVDIYWAV